MNTLVQRTPVAPTTRMGKQSRLPSKVARELDQATYTGLVAARRVHAAAYATHVAMQNVAMLSADEATLIEMSPIAEPRLKVLVDQYTAVAVREIQDEGMAGRHPQEDGRNPERVRGARLHRAMGLGVTGTGGTASYRRALAPRPPAFRPTSPPWLVGRPDTLATRSEL